MKAWQIGAIRHPLGWPWAMLVYVLGVLAVLALRSRLRFTWSTIWERDWRWRPLRPMPAPHLSADGHEEGAGRMVLLSQYTNPEAAIGIRLRNRST
jgi:hypothetical protein